MKKWSGRLWCLAVAGFFADWAFVGLSVLRGNYEILGGVIAGAVCLAVILLRPFLKLFRVAGARRGQTDPE